MTLDQDRVDAFIRRVIEENDVDTTIEDPSILATVAAALRRKSSKSGDKDSSESVA